MLHALVTLLACTALTLSKEKDGSQSAKAVFRMNFRQDDAAKPKKQPHSARVFSTSLCNQSDQVASVGAASPVANSSSRPIVAFWPNARRASLAPTALTPGGGAISFLRHAVGTSESTTMSAARNPATSRGSSKAASTTPRAFS